MSIPHRLGLLAFLTGCASPAVELGPHDHPAVREHLRFDPALRPAVRDTRNIEQVRRFEAAPAPIQPVFAGSVDGPDAATSPITEPIRDAHYDQDLGNDLTAFLDGLDREDTVLGYDGIALATPGELFSDDVQAGGLCEQPVAKVEFEEDGTEYEARLLLTSMMQFLGDLNPAMVTLRDQCIEGLLASAGDVDAAVAAEACSEHEELEFFEAGTSCRSCVEGNGGDYAACVDEDECDSQALGVWVQTEAEGDVWYGMLYTDVLACAPDWTNRTFLLVDRDKALAGQLVEWDHGTWAHMVVPFWDDTYEGMGLWVYTDVYGGSRMFTLAAGTIGYAEYIREAGTDGEPWAERGFYADGIELGLDYSNWFWAPNPGIGAVSAPLDYEDTDGDGTIGAGDLGFGFGLAYSMGLNPTQDRPDGESMARDYIAAEILKSSTHINGVWISIANHTRCTSWAGPDADGAYRCDTMDPPEAGWMSDGEVAWADGVGWEPGTVSYTYGTATIASTGLPDPDVPGGWVIHLAGSEAMAAPGFEGCDYEQRVVPDRARLEDVPYTFGTPGALTADVYRFGKDDADLRVVLTTNTRREYCPGGGP